MSETDTMSQNRASDNAAKWDTPWTKLRWRVALWFVYRGLRIAPPGSAAMVLEDMLRDWAEMCRVGWAACYPENGDV